MASGREAFLEMAWRDFVGFAWEQPDAHSAYRAFAGLPQRPKYDYGPIAALIDNACGVDEASEKYAAGFVDWVTEHHWGTDEAPKKWREKFLAARSANQTETA